MPTFQLAATVTASHLDDLSDTDLTSDDPTLDTVAYGRARLFLLNGMDTLQTVAMQYTDMAPLSHFNTVLGELGKVRADCYESNAALGPRCSGGLIR